LFAIDRAWWDIYVNDVFKNFYGAKIIGNPCPKGYNLTSVTDIGCYGNSGIGAISLAIRFGAKKVILIGYDCSVTDNKTHWHGDHVAGLDNARRIDEWPILFNNFAANITTPIINATRTTALRTFPIVSLEYALS